MAVRAGAEEPDEDDADDEAMDDDEDDALVDGQRQSNAINLRDEIAERFSRV